MELTIRTPRLGIDATVNPVAQAIDAAIDPCHKFSAKLVGLRAELLSGGVQISAKLGKGGIHVGSEMNQSRLNSAKPLIHLLVGTLQVGDANLQSIGHKMMVTQLSITRVTGGRFSFLGDSTGELPGLRQQFRRLERKETGERPHGGQRRVNGVAE